jgi:mycothiol synthase
LIPEGYRVRPAAWEDLDDVAALLVACDLADWGSPDSTIEELREAWKRPEIELSTDAWVVADAEGLLAGYGWLLARDSHTTLDGWAAVHPEHRAKGIGSYLVDLMELRGSEHAAQAPEGREVLLHNHLIAVDGISHLLLEGRGYVPVRHFWRMDIKLMVEPALSEPPAGIEVRGFVPGEDERIVHAVVEDSFFDHWGWVPRSFEDWAVTYLDPAPDPGLWLLALDGAEVAGVLLGDIADRTGWVRTLGVRRRWRGGGIGEHLLRRSFAEFHRRGLQDVSLNVDAGNETGATRLYERVGMQVARQYDTFEKRLR